VVLLGHEEEKTVYWIKSPRDAMPADEVKLFCNVRHVGLSWILRREKIHPKNYTIGASLLRLVVMELFGGLSSPIKNSTGTVPAVVESIEISD
jgi:hypothetical protein